MTVGTQYIVVRSRIYWICYISHKKYQSQEISAKEIPDT